MQFIKPTLAKIFTTIAIIVIALFYSDLNRTMNQALKNHIAESYVGKDYAEKLRQIYEAYPCEATKKTIELEVETIKDAPKYIEFVEHAFALIKYSILALLSYLMACLAHRKKNLQHAI